MNPIDGTNHDSSLMCWSIVNTNDFTPVVWIPAFMIHKVPDERERTSLHVSMNFPRISLPSHLEEAVVIHSEL